MVQNRIKNYLDELYTKIQDDTNIVSLCSLYSYVIQIKSEHMELKDYNETLYVDVKCFIENYVANLSQQGKDYGYDAVDVGKIIQHINRGQNDEVVPCIPTIYRGNPNDAQIFLQRMRLVQFHYLLRSHPVVTHFFAKHHFLVDEEGLAQHYGLKTEVLDLTSNLDVALFFATCKYNGITDSYDYYHEPGIHEGVLYVFDPFRDNELVPSFQMDKYMNGKITPIGLQAFPRPGAQYGYALHIKKGESTKSWMYKFTFTSEESKYYFDLFQKGESLWIKDKLIGKTKKIAEQTSFSFRVFRETFDKYRPKGWSKKKMKKALEIEGVILVKNQEMVLFDETEQREIVDEWNNHLGEATCNKIVRKCWFEDEGIEKRDGSMEECVNISNYSSFNTLNHIAYIRMICMLTDPNGPEGAEWKCYVNSPRPQQKKRPMEGEWEKVPGTSTSIFGKSFLVESDWKIEWQDDNDHY